MMALRADHQGTPHLLSMERGMPARAVAAAPPSVASHATVSAEGTRNRGHLCYACLVSQRARVRVFQMRPAGQVAGGQARGRG